ncbi:uncharacterized protein CXQ87_002163 [Candidozyma duobushaemuli]|uniref:Autophagy-related protein 13 n=1 Tax=Candidozyma duobushaemuli TaxID=1231522 RepID=A0A2V1A7H4_9ASCO|nr:uncharacterized protein CXQ87_002163 [[Candida] duobushaemulonis]PVH14040.1 hypothetical protein CXQ87_002163 [[Candida] duobushaemulonis]
MTDKAVAATKAPPKQQNTKLLQVIQNFFTKTSQIILQTRSVADPTVFDYGSSDTTDSRSKTNKWFNLNIASPGDDWIKDEMKLWKETVALEDDTGNSWTVAKGGLKKQEVVVERWLIEFDRSVCSDADSDELPLIYKQAIVLLRVIYGYARLLPAYKLRMILCQQSGKGLALMNKIIDGKQPISSKGRIGLSKSIIPHQMLLTESHMTQKSFEPVKTTAGSLRVSVAYRNHYRFTVQDNEEMLSNHFWNTDQEKLAASLDRSHISDTPSNSASDSRSASVSQEEAKAPKEPTNFALNTTKQSISPCTSEHQPEHHTDTSPTSKTSTNRVKQVSYAQPAASVQRPSIQPFKVGSISNSPPSGNISFASGAAGSVAGSTMERRISITSNKSGSNASLAALLRNPRGSTSSSNTPTVAISGSHGNNPGAVFPRSISSSHGSHLHDDLSELSGTPRFSSSFGSRQSRRFSNTSARSSVANEPGASLYGASVESTTSSGAPLSGLYLDDDISTFVRMIDCKSDLRLSSTVSKTNSRHTDSNSSIDALSKFQSLKGQHQQLSDSVNASVIFQHNQGGSYHSTSRGISRPSSRNSYDNHLPSITSKLESHSSEHSISHLRPRSRQASQISAQIPQNYGRTRLASSPTATSTLAHAVHRPEGPEVTGLSTTPSVYDSAKRPIKYEDVFDDEEEDASDYFMRRVESDPTGSRTHEEMGFDNDDLLFEMTDTK